MPEETRTDDPLGETVAMAHRFYRDARDHSSEWRNDAFRAYDMVAGRQWEEEDLWALRDQNRPAVTFNRIMRTINAVVGTQVANRQEVRYIPRELGDAGPNEVLTAAGEWVRDSCEAEDEESDAFEDMCTCGMGWTETRLDYETDPEGMVKIERIDPLEMFWDPGATKRNLADARWFMRVRTMTVAEFKQDWPDADPQLAAAPWEGMEDDVSQRTHVYPQDAYKHQQTKRSGKSGPKIRVAQVQWAEKTQNYRVGKRAERVSAEKFEKLRDKLEERGIAYMRQPGVQWKQAFVAGAELLEEGDCPFSEGPTLRAMTYKRDRNRNTWYGIVQAMIDPQRYGNKFFSQILDILNKGAKGGILVENDATDDHRKLEENWARPDSVHWLRPGAISGQKIMPKPLVNMPAGLDKLMTFSMDAVHEVTGINLELLGFANREQPGVLEAQRKQAGLTIIAPLFDAMRRYRKEQGRVLLHFIQEYLSDGRLIRITGKKGDQYVPLAKEDETAKYDVIVDEAPTSPNMKERVYGALVEMMPALAKMGIPLPPEILDYAPIPSALAQSWKELVMQSGGDPEAMRKQLEEAGQEIEKMGKEIQTLRDKKDETIAELNLQKQKQDAELTMKAEEQHTELLLKRQELEAEIALKRQELEAKYGIDLANMELGNEGMISGLGQMLQNLAVQVQKQTEVISAPKAITIERDPQTGLIQGAEATPRPNGGMPQ